MKSSDSPKRDGIPFWIGLACAAVTAICVLMVPIAGSGGAKAEAVRRAPDFVLTSVDGVRYQLSELRGKVVFLNIWATWCPPCRQEVPSMVRLYETFRQQGLEILAVSEDRDVAAVKKFMRTHRISFPVLMDPDKKVYKLYRATGVPETHLIDKTGALQASQLGPFDWMSPEVIQTVQTLLRR